MLDVFKGWYKKYFSDTEATILFFILALGLILLMTIGDMLAPAIASVIIAYLLQWGVINCQKLKIPHLLAVFIIFFAFVSLVAIALIFLLPILWHQFISLFEDLPSMLNRTQELLYLLPERFPDYINNEQVSSFIASASKELRSFGRLAVTSSLSSIPDLIGVIVYFVLVPVLIFFMLKDKAKIVEWFSSIMPDRRGLLVKVWEEVDGQIGNYIRGKVAEIIIVGGISYIFFLFMTLKYAALLAVLVGLSVLIPYVGAAVVTVPVLLVGYFQFGLSNSFGYLAVGYFIIQILDGNVLVPLLFSEAVNLHPVAIIVAILVFGGFWGFWGVFFAIPLATLVKAVIYAWPILGHEIAENEAS